MTDLTKLFLLAIFAVMGAGIVGCEAEGRLGDDDAKLEIEIDD